MPDFLDSQTTVPCPTCGTSTKTTLRRVRAGSTIRCPRGHQIKLVTDSASRREMDKADRAMKDLQRTLRNFGK